jgi:DNA-directed RNA polymerase specialized sigma24 family protein
VAAILGMSQAAVRVHLSRGRRRLRELLEESDG